MRPVCFDIYEDTAGEWRWHAIVNGRIVADSGEGYSTASNARRAVRRFITSVQTSPVVIGETEVG